MSWMKRQENGTIHFFGHRNLVEQQGELLRINVQTSSCSDLISGAFVARR